MTNEKSPKRNAIRLIIAGPTGVGKSAVAVQLANLLHIPVISADSRQCYRYMDIGTGKIRSVERQGIHHYNISNLDPDEKDNATLFLRRSVQWENEITSEYPLVLYAGGSTLYLEALLRPFDDLPSSNPENVKKMERVVKEKGIGELYEKLNQVDPEYAKQMDGLNTQRIIRALDVYEQTGIPFSKFHSNQKPVAPPDGTLVYVLNRERETLHERISQRVDDMIERGLVEEVQLLLDRGFSPELNALQTVGYREIISYLNGEFSLDRAVELIKRNTRRYARRQLTWFRRWKNVTWIEMDQPGYQAPVLRILNDLKTLAANAIIP